MTNFTSIILQLKDPNVHFDLHSETVSSNGGTSLNFFGTCSLPQSFCPHCQATAPDVVKNGKRTSTIKLLDVSGISDKLVLAKQRYFCKRCMKSSTASLYWNSRTSLFYI